MSVRIQLRRDTAANWTADNPVLAQTETGVETDTSKFKFGDGTTAWTSLPYTIDVGPQGPRGPQGFQGTQGAQGFQGSTGTQGFTGNQGSQGSTGITGTQGSQGPQGNQGSQGTTGAQGTQGPQGVAGGQGNQGSTGGPGPQGPQGSPGSTGVTRNQGATGSQGSQGSHGAGTQGTQGSTGNTGTQGAIGSQGPQGSQGFQGTQGSTGNTGTQGAIGSQGPQGSQGDITAAEAYADRYAGSAAGTASRPLAATANIPESQVTNLATDLSAKAPLTSPAFLVSPTAPTQAAGDNSTKISTDAFVATAVANAIAGVNPAVAVLAATTLASNTSGLTYANGVGGVGATLTGAVNTALTFDGVTFTAIGQQVLVKNDTQAPSGAFNGVYFLSVLQTALLAPVLTRALDYDQPSDINNTGAIPVQSGTANIATSWLLTSQVVTVGTSPLTYVIFSYSPASLFNRYAVLTSSGQTLTVPAGVTKIRARIRGGGGQGGGAGSASNTTAQAGGGGGGAGEVKDEEVTVVPGDVLTATIGAGGSAVGGGGAAGGHAGTLGTPGGTTS